MCACPEEHSISSDGLVFLDWNYKEVGQPACRADRDGESRLAWFHVIRNFTNEICHFSGLCH